MGVYFHYANLTKRERFAVNSLGGGIKFSALGRTLAARAFHLLMVSMGEFGRTTSAPMGPGHWAADSIAIVGDDLVPDWEGFKNDFTDIEADVIVLVFNADGFEEIGAAAAKDDALFMQLCYLVSTRQAMRLEPHMRERFGTNFLQRYKDLCRDRTWFVPKDLVAQQGTTC
ncbi:MAG: hypothetical protein GYA33_01620 [Thermogutta sp.]|nr:hypothetical protein [Thermogutta sp.]